MDALRETLRNRTGTLWLEHIAADIDVSLTWIKEFSRGYAPAKENTRYSGARPLFCRA